MRAYDEHLTLRLFLSIGLVITGTSSFYMARIQNIFPATEEQCPSYIDKKNPRFYYHPFLQTFLMFFGEFLCLIYHFLHKRCQPSQYVAREDFAKFKNKYPPRPMIYAIPAALDFLSSLCYYLAVYTITGSTFQFFRIGALFTTAWLGYKIAKVALRKHHKIGFIIAVLGMGLICASELLMRRDYDEQTWWWLGLIVMTFGIFMASLYYTYEQRMFSIYHVEPYKLVGMEGMWGMLFTSIGIAVATFVPAPYFTKRVTLCYHGEIYMENVYLFFKNVSQHSWLIFFCVGLSISTALLNIIGVYVTKTINALARSILDATRSVLVWIVGIAVTLTLGKGTDQRAEQYKFESLEWGIITLKIGGFILLIFAVLVYNDLIKIQKFRDDEPLKDEEEALSSLYE